MTTQSHFQMSTIGEIHRKSMSIARQETLTGVQHRPGTTGGTPSRQTIDAYNKWYVENYDRPKYLADPVARVRGQIGHDFLPKVGSEKFGVNASSIELGPARGARGLVAKQLTPGEGVELPDRRDSFGHNPKNKLARARTRGGD